MSLAFAGATWRHLQLGGGAISHIGGYKGGVMGPRWEQLRGQGLYHIGDFSWGMGSCLISKCISG